MPFLADLLAWVKNQDAPAEIRPTTDLGAFKKRMEILNSIPPSTTGSEAIALTRLLNPNIKLSIGSGLGPMEGSWNPTTGIVLPPPETVARGTPEHEFSHELQYLTGIGTNLGRGKGPYAKYGAAPRPIVEGAADVLSGTRGYLPDLTIPERSQAKAFADMTLAAAREMARQR